MDYRCINYRPMGSKKHLLDAHWKTESSQKIGYVS